MDYNADITVSIVYNTYLLRNPHTHVYAMKTYDLNPYLHR